MTKIIVGIDRSESGLDATAFAGRLARAGGAEVILAAAYPFVIGGKGDIGAYDRAIKAEAAEDLERARELLGDGVAVSTRVLPDPSAAHALHALAEEEAAALVVVGSAHAGHLGRVFPGTVGERLLHGSPCPVAVVPRGCRDRSGGLAAIGCAYDGSDEAKTALRAATEVARAVGGTLRIVMAVQPPAMVHTGAPGPAYVELLEDIRAAARAELDNAIRELPADVQPEPVLAEDVDVVGRLARESEALDLLVVGSRGYGPLRAVLLGGVTGPLMREAACPIVAIPRGATAALGSLFRAAAAPSEA